jgi:hypothetical protein
MKNAVLFILLLLLSGCAAQEQQVKPAMQCKWPEIPNNGGCCRDLNDNKVCDTIDLASEIAAEKQQEYEAAALKAQITANRSGKYKPTIMNQIYENASAVNAYRFYYQGDEIVVANGTTARKLMYNYPLGDQDIRGRRMKVFVNTVHLDMLNKKAEAECIPPEKAVIENQGTPCDDIIGMRFEVPFDKFAFKMPIKWVEEFLYRTPFSILPGSHIGKRPASIYKFSDLQDSRRTTIVWIDDLAAMPLRVEIWQNNVLDSSEEYQDFFTL